MPQLTIIGAGELAASSYVPAAASLGWKTVLVDRDVDRAERLARRHRGIVREVQSSIETTALDRESAVVIATPAGTHAELGLQAIRQGARQILLEKPPTTSWSEYEELTAAADAVGATIKTSFLRRGWQSMKAARAGFDEWVAMFGPLRQASLLEGAPWGWKSIATREQGSEGLDDILLQELPHGFDCLFYVTHWESPVRHETLSVDATRWEFRGAAVGDFRNEDLRLEIAISRTQMLANGIVLDFDGATVTVEFTPAGGICIRPTGEAPQVLEGPSRADSVPEQFARLLQGAFTLTGAGETSPSLSEWKGPLALIAGFRAASPGGQPVESMQ